MTKFEKSIECIIPARSGSKRIVNKNIVKLEGIPLIDHTVKLCNSCNFIDRAFISTDSKAIAKRASGKVSSPFLRPKHLCEDNSTDIGYLNHFLEWRFSEYNTYPTWLILMRPTSPFRHKSLVEKILSRAVCAKKSLRTVSRIPTKTSPQWLIEEGDDGFAKNYIKNGFTVRSQELRTYFYPNGILDIIYVKDFLGRNSVFGDSFCIFETPEQLNNDIDTMEDLEFLEGKKDLYRAGWEKFLNDNY